MKIVIVSFFLYSIISCSSLLRGEQIDALWNGKYEEAVSGSAYLNVGAKMVDIRNIDIIPSLPYNVYNVLTQETELKVWLEFEGNFIAMQMTRDVLTLAITKVFLDAPIKKKGDFPINFDTNITMIRF